MDKSGTSEVAARMLEMAQRLADTIAAKAAPLVSEAPRQASRGIRYGLDRTTRSQAQCATEFDRLGARGQANSDTAGRAATEDELPVSTIWERASPCARDRSELSGEEAQELYERVRYLEPDAAGTGNRVNLVDTRVGPAVVRRELDQPTVTLLKKWMPENAAIDHARASGVRTPRILYSGTDPSTGREFTIMQYVPGETRGFNDPETMNWLPDLLDQVQLMSSHPLPAGMNLDIPEWQQQMVLHADDAYRSLASAQRTRLDRLGIGPLSDYVQSDLSRAGEPTVFAHNDLYPSNLRLDDQGKLWILDWETAGPGDPLYNASLFLQRMGTDVDDMTRAQATDMWLDRISPANTSVDTGETLDMYRTMEDWRAVTMYSETMPRTVSTDPNRFEGWVDWYDTRLSRNPEPWPGPVQR